MPGNELETTWDTGAPSALPWHVEAPGVEDALVGNLAAIPDSFPPKSKEYATAFAERFWNETHMSFERKQTGVACINMRRDSASEKDHPKIAEITISWWSDDELANMQVNPYAHMKEFYFQGKWLSCDDALGETAAALSYLRGEISALPEVSKLKQINYADLYDLSAYGDI